MGTRAITLGPTGRTVAANIASYRALRGLRLADLSDRMTTSGRPLSVVSLSAIENGERRADVDDLVALAAALDISPAALLMPASSKPSDPAPATVHPEGDTNPDAAQLWGWLTAQSPLDAPLLMAERDEVAIEMWRREQVPVWDRRPRTANRD